MEPPVKRAAERLGIYEAKNRLSELVERVISGEEFVITRHGRPVARLVPDEAKAVDPQAVVALFEELRQLSTRFAPDVTVQELRGYVKEGRR